MYKVHDNIKQFYVDFPEGLELRRQISRENLEYYLEYHNVKDMSKEVFEKWERVWDVATSFWMFPDEEDMKNVVNEVYAKHETLS